MDGHVGEALAQRAHQHRGGARLQQAGHVLDRERVHAVVHQLLRQREVVVQVVLGLGWVGHVASVAQRALRHAACFGHRVDAKLEVIDVVQRVKHAEDVDAALFGLNHKLVHDVVRVAGVADRVGAAQQHLERNVGDQLAQLLQAAPGALVQEAQRHVKRRAAPHLERASAREHARHRGRGLEHVERAHARRKQRLVCVTQRCVGQQHTLVLANRLSPGLGSLLDKHVTPSRQRGIKQRLGDRGRRDRHLRWRRACRARMVGAVDHVLRKVQ
mmetsp:Transcript_19234/g.57098  ORF Transcript_19234/g.57098 Transcript_19234/m.57098 type:complete len:272 (-) Transcript_19234:1685-2500(-)